MALTAAVGRQAARVAAATAEYLRLVAEVLARGLWADQGARTPAHWLSHEVGIGTSTAKDHVRVAVRLRGLPRIRARFASGRISYTKVRAITRIAVPELEPLLLRWCDVMTGSEVERTVRGFRRSTHPGAATAGRDAGRSWRRRENGDGTSTLTIVAPDEEVDELEQLCQQLADRDDADADGADPGASAEATDRAGERGGRLVTSLLHLAVAGAAGRSDTSGLDRWTLTLHADLADLADPATDASDPASAEADAAGEASAEAHRRPDRQIPVWSATGRPRTMCAATMRRLACEAGITLVIDGADGTPLEVGRRQREPTTAQRRALYARDRTCRFPGCEATRHLHAHHVVHWADGGLTDLANLVLICSYHHRFVHEHGWEVTPAAAGTFTFAPPDGDPLPRARILDAADDGWTHDPLEDDRLHPRDRHGDELDVGYVVQLLHQELRRAAGIPTAA